MKHWKESLYVLLLFVQLLAPSFKVLSQPAVLPAHVDVSALGAGTYTIPINTVPGTGTAQPTLSIVYNSMSGTGQLGQKWHLQGLSAITRVQQTQLYDGTTTVVAFDTSDRLALDGMRMLMDSGSHYHANGTRYLFEQNNLTYIKYINNSTFGHFSHYLTDGTIVDYGRNNNSRLIINDTDCMAWMASRVTDAEGNYMIYNYQQADGEIWINRIDYTYLVNGVTAYARVAFEYRTVRHPNDSYISGRRFRHSKLMTGITILYQNRPVRYYSFDYDTTQQYERLVAIHLLDSNRSPMSTTTISWEEPASPIVTESHVWGLNGTYYIVPGNFDDDRIYDLFLVHKDNLGTYFRKGTANGSFEQLQSANFPFPANTTNQQTLESLMACDMDGDGIDEILYRQGTDAQWFALKFESPTLTIQETLFCSSYTNNLITGDFDGDGQLEAIAFHGDFFYAYQVNGLSIPIVDPEGTYFDCRAGDFDGDGKHELLLLHNNHGGVVMSFNTGNLQWEKSDTVTFNTGEQYTLTGDFNGDGMTDLLYLPKNSSQWNIAFRKGKGTWDIYPFSELDGSHPTSNTNLPSRIPIILDINGDGKSDILQLQSDNTVQYIYSYGVYNDTFRYSQPNTFNTSVGSDFKPSNLACGDFDGNGIADLVFCNPYCGYYAGKIFYFNHNSFPTGFVEQITDAAGKSALFRYSTISLMPSRYANPGMRWASMPLVTDLYTSNGVGGYDTNRFYYGEAQYDPIRRQFLGFGQFGVKQFHKITETFFSRVEDGNGNRYALLMPDSIVVFNTFGEYPTGSTHYHSFFSYIVQGIPGTVVSRTTNTNSALEHPMGGICSFLPYVRQSVQQDCLKNTEVVSTTVMDSSFLRPRLCVSDYGYITGSTNVPYSQTDSIAYTRVRNTNGSKVVKKSRTISTNYNSTSRNRARIDTITYTYSNSGRLTGQQYADNCGYTYTKAFSYNSLGLPVSETTSILGEGSRSTTKEYDQTGRFVTATVNHAGDTTAYTYNAATGLCLSKADPNRLVTHYEYDNWGRPTLTTRPDGTTQSIAYIDNGGGLSNACCHTVVTESGLPQTRTYYDCLGRTTHTFTGGQGFMDIVYHKRGYITKQTTIPYTNADAPSYSKHWRTFNYDRYQRLVCDSSQYNRNSISYLLGSGYLYGIQTQSQTGAISTQYYDAVQRIVKVVDEGGTVSYSDARIPLYGKVYDRKRISTNGNITNIVCDSRGNRIQIEDPDAGTVTTTYNGWNEPLVQQDANGNTVTMTYNSQGRLASKTYQSAGTVPTPDTYTYTYGTAAPAKGRVTAVQRNSLPYRQISYDQLGRTSAIQTTLDGTPYSWLYTYNSNGRLYTVTYPDGFTLRREYDDMGRLKHLKDHISGTSLYTVDARNTLGQPNLCWMGNQTGVEYSYNALGMPTRIKYGYKEVANRQDDPDSTRDDTDSENRDPDPEQPWISPFTVGNQYAVLQYSYNENGHISRRRDDRTGQFDDYTYDNLGRLTGYTVDSVGFYTFSYADNGNMLTNGRLGNDAYQYDGNHPHAVSSVVDNNGLISPSQSDIAYNSRNRPSSISEDGYNLLLDYGDRLQREKTTIRFNNNTLSTVYHIGDECDLEVTAGGARYVDCIRADGRVVALHVKNGTADSIYYVHTDLLGSWERIVADDRSVVQASHFDPWGNRMSPGNWTLTQDGSNFTFRRGFTGHEHYDRFGLINMDARLYDPVVGRFLSPDPQVQSPYSTQGFNRYSYCGNNPVMYIDPDGEFFWLIPVVIGAVVGGVQGYQIAKANGATGWDMFGYIAGGAVVGGIAGVCGAAAGAAVAGSIGIGGVIGGAFSAGVGGAVAGGINGFGMSNLSGNDLSESYRNAAIGMASGFVCGAVTGGVSGGIEAYYKGDNIWVGSDKTPLYSYKTNNTNESTTQQTPYQKGQEGVNRVIEERTKEGYILLSKEVTVEADGVRVRVDIAMKLDGETYLIEVKNGPYARLTPNQSIVYPKMNDNVPIIPFGKNATNVWPNYQAGTTITEYNLLIIHFK